MQIGWSILGINVWHETQRSLDDGKIPNAEFAKEVFPIA